MCMTLKEAKKLTREQLVGAGISFSDVRGRTIHFTDLARGNGLFVKVISFPFDGPEGNNTRYWHEVLKPFAKRNGFILESGG